MPAKEIRLETADATYFHFKHDVFKREITYSTDKNIPANLVTIDADRAFEVIALNKAGEKPLSLGRNGDSDDSDKKQYNDILGQDITRFDKKKKKKKKNKSPENRQQPPSDNRRQKIRPGDTPANDAPGAGRNAERDFKPALSPSRRMTDSEHNNAKQ